jgi:hypothetical protein
MEKKVGKNFKVISGFVNSDQNPGNVVGKAGRSAFRFALTYLCAL